MIYLPKKAFRGVADICKQPLNIHELMHSLKIDALKKRYPKELFGGQQKRVRLLEL